MSIIHTQMSDFRAASAEGAHWHDAAGSILRDLGTPGADHRLGIIYMTPEYAAEIEEIAIFLRQSTGVPHWVGTVGHGVVGRTEELFGKPGMGVMLCPFPEEGFRIFPSLTEDTAAVTEALSDWLPSGVPPIILGHGDPSNNLLLSLMDELCQETDGFLLGGVSAIQTISGQIADTPQSGGLSGVILDPTQVPVLSGLTQGCSPIGPARRVTRADDGIILEIDQRPALEVFKEDIGDLLARDLRKCAGYIFAALPVSGSDTADYTVRNLTAIDLQEASLTIGAHMREGDPILFCRRDPSAATQDMHRMLDDLLNRLDGKSPRGALYTSCAARGPNQFEAPETEIAMIREAFGDIPLVGFFANGEFNRDRMYAYTGVLTLFL